MNAWIPSISKLPITMGTSPMSGCVAIQFRSSWHNDCDSSSVTSLTSVIITGFSTPAAELMPAMGTSPCMKNSLPDLSLAVILDTSGFGVDRRSSVDSKLSWSELV